MRNWKELASRVVSGKRAGRCDSISCSHPVRLLDALLACRSLLRTFWPAEDWFAAHQLRTESTRAKPECSKTAQVGLPFCTFRLQRVPFFSHFKKSLRHLLELNGH